MTKKLVTIKSASEILSVSPSTLRNWDKSGKLKAEKNKINGYRLYDISALEKFADKYLHRKSRKIKLIK